MSSRSKKDQDEYDKAHPPKPIAALHAAVANEFAREPVTAEATCHQPGSEDDDDDGVDYVALAIAQSQGKAASQQKANQAALAQQWKLSADLQLANRPKPPKGPIKSKKFLLPFAKHSKVLEFHQYVPADSDSIVNALTHGTLSSAVYNTRKAFFVSWNIPGGHKLDISKKDKDMVLLVFTLSDKAARSLVEDYLVCQNEVADDLNQYQVDKRGETDLPCYTLWKTNEPGSFGIGQYRLGEIDTLGVDRVQAFTVDKQGKVQKELKIDKKGKLVKQ